MRSMDKDRILLEPSIFTVEEWGSTTLGKLQQSLYDDVGVDVPAPLIPHAQEALSRLVGPWKGTMLSRSPARGQRRRKHGKHCSYRKTWSC
mgnify:CR=1 FL=1